MPPHIHLSGFRATPEGSYSLVKEIRINPTHRGQPRRGFASLNLKKTRLEQNPAGFYNLISKPIHPSFSFACVRFYMLLSPH